jgi:putative ABC transport system permease protein
MFRRNLVVFQFSISTILIIGMIVVYSQLSYIQTRSIGFDRENVVIISAGSSQIEGGYETLRNKLLNNSRIVNVASSADLPGDEYFSNGNVYSKENMENNASMTYMFCDFNFIDTYKMQIIAGRNFSKDFSTDTAGTIIMNEAAVKRLGWTPEDAVGKKLMRGGPLVEYRVAGVVKDYNFRSLREEIEPMIMILAPGYISRISVRILPGNLLETIDNIEQKWHEIFPAEQFEYGFMDERIDQLYQNEKKMQSLLLAFSALSILVACLGLFGLAAYNAEEKKKEIGIRKTLGASISSILQMLTKEYFKWILISIIISWPVSYYLMHKWLQNYAYRIDLGWLPFIISAGFSFLIALITVSIQVLKAAMTNPVDALKYE